MPLQLHVSATASELLQQLRTNLAHVQQTAAQRTSGIPRPIPVLVNSTQVSEWLQIRLARDRGVCMGFQFQPVASFFRKFTGADPMVAGVSAALAAWSRDALRWRLLPLIDTYAADLGHPAGTPLTPRARFAFAGVVAQTFDRYTCYRLDWAERWKADAPAEESLDDNADERWQRALWRQLLASTDVPHPSSLLRNASASDQASGNEAPLFVVLNGAIDPLTLEFLRLLGTTSHAVFVYALLPSLGYLGDIGRRKSLSESLAGAPTDPDAQPIGAHPLLASLGQEAVGTFSLLGTLSTDYAEWPTDNTPPDLTDASLLRRVQGGIRHELPPAGAPSDAVSPDLRPLLAPNDVSVRLHACHSARRELEVVRDELLRAFADLPDLKPDDVLIAATDFDLYAPLAEGVLRSGAQPLPVRLTSVPGREANPVAAGMLAFLRLALGRCAASEVIELLNLPAVQAHLDADADAVAHLADLVRNSGLTYGCDTTHRQTADDTGTWRAALDRILAGLWFGPSEAVTDAAGATIHPVGTELHGDEALELRFACWIAELASQLTEWQRHVAAAEWAARLGAAADALLHAEDLDDDAVAFRRQLGELAHVAADTPLDTGAILDWLEEHLENATSLRTSISGEILFGRLDQVRGLPCRVLVIMGLQDGAFPRANRRPAWDLLSRTFRRGDTDPRTQDRQLFLDALLAPADRLILSAANRSTHTGHDGPWSSCVEEFLRIAGQTVSHATKNVTLTDALIIRHRIHPFTSDYFVGTALPRSYDSAAAQIVADVMANHDRTPRPFFLPAPSQLAASAGQVIPLESLVEFWRDPARAWIRALNIELPRDEVDDTELDAPPVGLDGLQRYGLREYILAQQLSANAAGSSSTSIGRLAADRELPPGALGSLTWKVQQAEMALLLVALRRVLPSSGPRTVEANLAGVRVAGEVLLLRDEPVVLVYRPGDFSGPKYWWRPFIHAIVATIALETPVACLPLGLDAKDHVRRPGLPVEEARRVLTELVKGFNEGHTRPLGYAPGTSDDLAKALAAGAEREAALRSAANTWYQEESDYSAAGEGFEPAAALAWRDGVPFVPPHADDWLRWAEVIARPLQQWWNV